MLIECIDLEEKVKLTHLLADVARTYLAEGDFEKSAAVKFYKTVIRTVSKVVDTSPVMTYDKLQFPDTKVVKEEFTYITQELPEYEYLDNLYVAPFVIDTILFSSVEHASWYYKNEDDYTYLATLLSEIDTKKVRKLAMKYLKRHNIAYEDDSDAELHRLSILIDEKFMQNPELKEKLVKLKGKAIIYTNKHHDNLLGRCTCVQCNEIESKNYLGRLLMQVAFKK